MNLLITCLTIFLTLSHSTLALRFRQGLQDPPKIGVEPPKEMWYNQSLDHFKPGDSRTWLQRYWINWEHYKVGGPVLLMIGGEGEANPVWMNTGAWKDYAASVNGAMMLLEHRYYGKSHPTEDLSVKNLNWLTSQQALADIASFITSMNQQHNIKGRWIALGGSYPGSLAAWARLKYPHLIHGSVSTSGPLKAKADFYEYLEVVTDALDKTRPDCSATLNDALKKVQMMTRKRSNWGSITNMFNLCTPFNGNALVDITNLFETLIGNFEGIVQYNKDNRDFEGAKWTNITIDTLCSMMDDNELGSSLERLKAVNDLSLKMSEEKCLDHTYKSMVSELQEVGWDSTGAAGGRQWTYQTCTEFGWYQSSDSPKLNLGKLIPVRFFEYMCTDIFGPKFDIDLINKGVEDTNTYYGGLDIEVTNTVFVHGTTDPWHRMGITETNKSGMEAILIPGTAHCANMYPPSPQDPPALVAARKRIGELIAKWVSD